MVELHIKKNWAKSTAEHHTQDCHFDSTVVQSLVAPAVRFPLSKEVMKTNLLSS